jgi:cytidylate kinase
VRARRVAEREGADWQAVLEENRARHGSDSKRYKTIYGYDLADVGVYDVVLSTDDRTPEQLVDQLVAAARRRFEGDGAAAPPPREVRS